MLPASLHLFEQITPNMFHLIQELDKPKLRNMFNVNKSQVQLTLTDNFIVLSDHLNFRSPTHFCKLNFDLKFEVIYQTSQVYLTICSKRTTLERQPHSNFNAMDATNNLLSTLLFSIFVGFCYYAYFFYFGFFLGEDSFAYLFSSMI